MLLPEAKRAEYQNSIRGAQFMFDWFRSVDFDGPAIKAMLAAMTAHEVNLDRTRRRV